MTEIKSILDTNRMHYVVPLPTPSFPPFINNFVCSDNLFDNPPWLDGFRQYCDYFFVS